MKLLEPELEDISTVAEDIPRLYIQKKNRPLLPLSVMGNGISRLVGILCSMLEYPRAIILIDEIESGFHYSFFPQLWKSIEFLAKWMCRFLLQRTATNVQEAHCLLLRIRKAFVTFGLTKKRKILCHIFFLRMSLNMLLSKV